MSHGDPAWLCYSVPWYPIVYYIIFSPHQKCKDWTRGTAVCSCYSLCYFHSVFTILVLLSIIVSFKQDAYFWFSIILCLLKPSPITNEINSRLRKIWPFMWVIVRLQYWVSPSFEDYQPTKYNPGERSAKFACGPSHSCLNKSCSGPCPALPLCCC